MRPMFKIQFCQSCRQGIYFKSTFPPSQKSLKVVVCGVETRRHVKTCSYYVLAPKLSVTVCLIKGVSWAMIWATRFELDWGAGRRGGGDGLGLGTTGATGFSGCPLMVR